MKFEPYGTYGQSMFPGKPWRVMYFVVAPDGAPTETTLTRYCETEEEANSYVCALEDATADPTPEQWEEYRKNGPSGQGGY